MLPHADDTVQPLVLVAEDDAEFRGLLAGALRRRHLLVEEIADGAALFARLDAALGGHSRLPDVVVTDIRMPHLSGLDALRACAASRLPVLVITAFGDPDTHARAFAAGASAVLDKPFDVRVLVAHVDYLLQLRPESC